MYEVTFGISGVSDKTRDNPGNFGILGRYGTRGWEHKQVLTMGDFDGRGNAPSSRLSIFLWIEWHASIIFLEEELAIPAAAAG